MTGPERVPAEASTPLSRFFERYAELSQDDEPAALAALYAPTFIVAGPQGSKAFENDARFVEWLHQVRDFNRQHGMRSLEVTAIQEIALSPRHSLARVTWGVRFDRTGDRLIEFEIAYLLEQDGDRRTILSYVSRSDQEQEMKSLGLM
jgi:hypothetical protein